MSPEFVHILGNVPWPALQDAYGKAVDVPRLVAQMLSSDLMDRQNAIDDLLYSRAYHQFAIYSVTPEVVNVAIHLLEDPSIAKLTAIPPRCVEDELVHFCRICAEGETSDQAIRERIADLLCKNREVFRKRTVSSLQATARDAEWIMSFVTTARAEGPQV